VKNNQVSHNDTDISLLEDEAPIDLYCGNLTSSCTNFAAPDTTFRFAGNHASDAINYEDNPVGSDFGDGIDIDSVTQNMTVIHNVVENDPGNGVALFGTTGVVAQRNTVRSDDNGFYLGAGSVGVSANANTLRKNTVSSSSNVGILLDTQSGGNTLIHNSSQLNSVLDAQDNSSGVGTAGTGNSWEANDCTTSAPSGLCHSAASVRSGAKSAPRASASSGVRTRTARDALAVRRARPVSYR
jgi:parallel beta-helix repeat protein